MFTLGKEFLYASICANLILIGTAGPKLIAIFGFTTNAGNVFYAAVFFATYLLIEHHDQKPGVRAIWIGSSAAVLFLIMTQLTLNFGSAPEGQAVSEAFKSIFRVTPRVALASISAYIIAQYLNVRLYHIWKQQTEKAFLWLRAGLTVVIAQMVDSIIFFMVAFLGVVSSEAVIQSLTTGYIIKVAVGFISIPLLYFSYRLKRLDN